MKFKLSKGFLSKENKKKKFNFMRKVRSYTLRFRFISEGRGLGRKVLNCQRNVTALQPYEMYHLLLIILVNKVLK